MDSSLLTYRITKLGCMNLNIYHGSEINAIDLETEKNGLDTFTLMENAGRSIFEAVEHRISKQSRIIILAGKGNNGGDGIVLARYLKINDYNVDLVFPLGESATEVSKKHLHYFLNCGYQLASINGSYDVIIDALLGVGTRLPLSEQIITLIQWANHQQAFRMAIDLPTGVQSDYGEVQIAFQSDLTLCLHGFKPSAFLEGSIEFYGEKQVLSIGLPQKGKWRIWQKKDVKATFLRRAGHAHKGTFGTGLLIAGCDEMPGSAMLASLGAMRAGIGKLAVATSPFASSIIATRVPECTYVHNGLERIAEGMLVDGYSAVAIGSGIKEEELIEKALLTLWGSNLPIILDAGALKKRDYPNRKAPIIVTPHPREFSKMTGITVRDIQRNRLELASKFSVENHVITILKGRNTVIAFPNGELLINETGNVGLAKGGTGDTLTGMLLAFLSSYQNVKSAVANAVYLHGASADYYKKERAATSMLASDVSENLTYVMKEFE